MFIRQLRNFVVLFHQHASYEAPDQDEEEINKELVESEDSKLGRMSQISLLLFHCLCVCLLMSFILFVGVCLFDYCVFFMYFYVIQVIQRTKQMQTRAKCKVCFQIPFC
jgi:hypothetical protein